MRIWQRRILGVLALGGSFLGLAVATMALTGGDNWLSKAIGCVFIAMYAWGIWCGLRMLENAPEAIRINSLFWAAQVPYFTSPILSYHFSSGIRTILAVQTGDQNLLWALQLGSNFTASLLRPAVWGIGVNVFALLVTVFLSYRYRVLATGKAADPGPALEAD